MDLNHPSTGLLFVTVPIQANINETSFNTGTGFIISIPVNDQNFIPVLVTNYHIVEGAKSIFIDLFKMNPSNKQPTTNEKIKVEIDANMFINFQSKDLDIAFIPLAPILENLSKKGIELFFKSITPNMTCSIEQEAKLAAIEEVTFIGYPYGIQERSKNLPIIRRGITATPIWSNFRKENNNETFLIDAGVFPGSSGSPVFIYNHGSYSEGMNIAMGTRLIFLGMIKISVQNSDTQFIGLGEVIKSKVIFNFIKNKLNINI